MSRVKNKNTDIELTVRHMVNRRGLKFRKHVAELHGCPDLVFDKARIAVFIDGDFWHGWRLSKWQEKLTPFWRKKIDGNRQRDVKNFRKLRRRGWGVIRLWQHQVEQDTKKCVDRIEEAVRGRQRRK